MTRAGNTSQTSGFTMIEVLVTISVIAILAAIVLAGYSAVQNRTFDSAVQSDLANDAKILAQYYSDNSDFPTGAELATLAVKLGFATSNYDASNNNALYCYTADGTKASLIAESRTGNVYYVTNTSRIPQVFGASFPQGGAIDCPNSGLPAGTLWTWMYGPGSGWASWVK
jgi:prepilin-type N-terminal cleavage/methylation domain-containing protein